MIFDDTQHLSNEVFIDGNFIVVKPESLNQGYDVSLDSCQSAEQILAWVHQLSEKSWITPEHLRRFIQLAGARIGLSVSI